MFQLPRMQRKGFTNGMQPYEEYEIRWEHNWSLFRRKMPNKQANKQHESPGRFTEWTFQGCPTAKSRRPLIERENSNLQ